MKLHEYQSKQIFAKYGIPIPQGRVASSAAEARQIAEDLGGRVVIKSQVLVGGRGKAGGIRLAKSPQEAGDVAEQVLRMEIKGLPCRPCSKIGYDKCPKGHFKCMEQQDIERIFFYF